MRLLRAKFLCGTSFLAGLMAPVAASAANNTPPAPDLAVIQKSVAVNNRDWKAQVLYGHRELDIKSKVDASGQLKSRQSRTYEVMMIEGSPYERLVGIDDEPLGRDLEQQERTKLNREITKRQNESKSDRQARVGKYNSERAEEHLLMQQMVDAFIFHFMGDEDLQGIPCYHFAALPNPNYIPPVEKARVLTGMRGEIWIHKQTYHWVRVRAEVSQPVQFGFFIAKVKPGTNFELDREQVGEVWLPKRFTQNVNASIFGVYGYRTSEEMHFSNYHETVLHAGVDLPTN